MDRQSPNTWFAPSTVVTIIHRGFLEGMAALARTGNFVGVAGDGHPQQCSKLHSAASRWCSSDFTAMLLTAMLLLRAGEVLVVDGGPLREPDGAAAERVRLIAVLRRLERVAGTRNPQRNAG